MTSTRLFLYSGAGNRFVILDGRGRDNGDILPNIPALCHEHGSDGLIILDASATADFKMQYFNPDGSSGMFCGNGGRCIVAFADSLGLIQGDDCLFEAPDGMHRATILQRMGKTCIVRLQMRDVAGYTRMEGGCFLDTGTRHFVCFVEDAAAVNVAEEGKALRWSKAFAPQGANINFVSRRKDGSIDVRTFEKGVEAETLACGTGITASAIANWLDSRGYAAKSGLSAPVTQTIHARIADLQVTFSPPFPLQKVFLTGPAEQIG